MYHPFQENIFTLLNFNPDPTNDNSILESVYAEYSHFLTTPQTISKTIPPTQPTSSISISKNKNIPFPPQPPQLQSLTSNRPSRKTRNRTELRARGQNKTSS
ncbi:hypothetical protein E2P81_ATG06018 [Venturia nashicola]|uniref:Uncharacterized protein n=1 Tax=Venturia nashicola TaxID=86259 RepID=A0A4Z1PBT1_9PEZI|nr:hypothetical protein E6O75_ATG06162 [Venturia nashicola]TLD29724.1 hypothetical protein E2P81_ATG06018 [Venturia nashicola]